MQSIFLTGANGLLGSSFCETADANIIPLDRALLAPGAEDSLRETLSQAQASILVNCAAHTDVEGAETLAEANLTANVDLPRRLAVACEPLSITLVHFSSTGCYGDWKATPYTEEDHCRPTTAHHRAKLAGEEAIISSRCEHLILRVGWLYGGARTQPKNFVWKRILEARSKDRMTSDAFQRGCPTFVDDVRDQALMLIANGARGTFNVVAHGAPSRFDYVAAIVGAAGAPCVVEPGPAFRRQAAVSQNETALNARLQGLALDRMPEWEAALASYVRSLL